MLETGLYNTDCMDGMKMFPDKFFDLAIVDPPYGNAANANKSGLAGGGSWLERPDRKIWRTVLTLRFVGRAGHGRRNTVKGVSLTTQIYAHGTLHRMIHTFGSLPGSAMTRLYGVGITLISHLRAALSYGARQTFREKDFPWLRLNMPGLLFRGMRRMWKQAHEETLRKDSTPHKNQSPCIPGCLTTTQNRDTRYLIHTWAVHQV